MLQQSRQIKGKCSKLSDWFIILCVLITTATLESNYIDPHFQCVANWPEGNHLCGEHSDPTLSYPKKNSTISGGMLAICAFLPWLINIISNVIYLFFKDPQYSSKIVLKNIEVLLRMLLFATCGIEAVVSCIKMSIGRPRPNFYALQRTGNTEDIKQSRMSFPSGHSSLSMSALFLLTLNLYYSMSYVQKRYRLQKKDNIKISIINPHSYFCVAFWWLLRNHSLISAVIAFIPTYLALYIGATRITDYWHHYADVAVGCLLGASGALISLFIFKDEFYHINIKDYGLLDNIGQNVRNDQLVLESSNINRNNEIIQDMNRQNNNIPDIVDDNDVVMDLNVNPTVQNEPAVAKSQSGIQADLNE